MQFAFSTTTRHVLEQLVRDPRFRPLTRIPVLALPEIGLILFAFGLFAAASAAYLGGWLPYPAMLVANTLAIYASFTPLHDATHRSLSGHRRVNDLLGTISCLLLLPGITTRIYRYLHLEHHRHTGSPERDPDEIMVSAPAWQLPFVLSCIDAVWIRWYVARWRQRPAEERRAFAVSIGIYVLVHAFFLASPWWREFLIVWVVPQRLGLFTVAYFFAHIQHPEDVQWEQAPFQTTVRVIAPSWIRALLLGQADHCIHHLMPSLPFYRYHRAWALGRHLFEQQRIPTRTLFTPSRDLVLPPAFQGGHTWLPARIVAITDVADGIKAFDLVPADGTAWPAATPGAHIDVETAPGVVRQYSLCGDPETADQYRIAVKREAAGRGGSRALHDRAAVGELINIGAPRSHFPLGDADHYVLIGGGIGVTPLLAMALALSGRGASFELHVVAASHARAPFADRLRGWFGPRAHLHIGRAAIPAIVPRWRAGATIRLCGPAGFMSAVLAAAAAAGWPRDAIATEAFTAAPERSAENRGFTVELARSGRVLTVPADRSLLDILQAEGCPVVCACTQGICGSCLTPVLSGTPDHRDVILSDEDRAANRIMTVCVSRARSERLVLDL